MDSEYVKRILGKSLVKCLTELNAVRPEDPIEYMAHWLHNDFNNDLITEQLKKDEVARQQARAEYEVVLQRQELMKAEQMVFTAERAKLHQLAEEQKRQEALLTLTSDVGEMEEEEKPISDGEEEESDEEADADDAEMPPASGTNLPFTPSNHHQENVV